MNQHHPFHPIVYVRGFAMTSGEIEDTVADPYMGFNIGSTKSRAVWNGDVRKFFFESPLVRLMSDAEYEDVFVEGDDLLELERSERPIDYKCVIIYRYYDEASATFGKGETPPIEHFAKGLGQLILKLRQKICENPKNGVTPEEFKVYLVAHSMGGLVCRAFLQNPKLGSAEARKCVDKLFTYATPHNGIDLRIVRNVPAWASFGDVNNFNREKMSKYLSLPSGDDVSVVRGFPAERIFNLVGTNPGDYKVLGGLSAWAAGDASDGLVCITNATTHGPANDGMDVSSPRAFVHRSHSGHYGIVNSEEGYQNLRRFLFGAVRVDGVLEIDKITLPIEVQQALDEGKDVKASYQFEVVVSIRGCQWQMHRRTVRENSAIFRKFDQLFPKGPNGERQADRSQSPHLFSVFLDPSKSVKTNGSVSFACDLSVLVPDYVVDGKFFLKRHYEGGYIYRDLLLVEAFPDEGAPGGWRIKYGSQEDNPGKPGRDAVTEPIGKDEGVLFRIPIEQKRSPGITASLRVEARPWNR
jgi:hypothetical protein